MDLASSLKNRARGLPPYKILDPRDPWPGIHEEFALLDGLDFDSASIQDLIDCSEALLLALDADYFHYMPRVLAVVFRSPNVDGAAYLFELALGPLEGGKERNKLAGKLDEAQRQLILKVVSELEPLVFGVTESGTFQELEALFHNQRAADLLP